MFTNQFKLLVLVISGLVIFAAIVYNQVALSSRLDAVATDVQGIHATLAPKATVTDTPIPTASPSVTIRQQRQVSPTSTKAPSVSPTKTE